MVKRCEGANSCGLTDEEVSRNNATQKVTTKVLDQWNGLTDGITLGKAYQLKPSSTSGFFMDDLGTRRSVLHGTWHDLPTSPKTKASSRALANMSGEKASASCGKQQSADKAMRFNSGKPQLSYLLDADIAMEGMCKVMEFGAAKYERGNWKKGLDDKEIMDSLLRHLTSYANGEVLDPESGLPHIDHVTCNSVFLATFGDRNGKDSPTPK